MFFIFSHFADAVYFLLLVSVASCLVNVAVFQLHLRLLLSSDEKPKLFHFKPKFFGFKTELCSLFLSLIELILGFAEKMHFFNRLENWIESNSNARHDIVLEWCNRKIYQSIMMACNDAKEMILFILQSSLLEIDFSWREKEDFQSFFEWFPFAAGFIGINYVWLFVFHSILDFKASTESLLKRRYKITKDFFFEIKARKKSFLWTLQHFISNHQLTSKHSFDFSPFNQRNTWKKVHDVRISKYLTLFPSKEPFKRLAEAIRIHCIELCSGFRLCNIPIVRMRHVQASNLNCTVCNCAERKKRTEEMDLKMCIC